MSVSQAWRRARSASKDAGAAEQIPGHGHTVCFYDRDDELVERLTRYVTDGAALGQRTIVIAEHHHIKGLRMRLAAWDLVHVLEPHDATWALSRFMTADGPDEGRFRALLDRVLPADRSGVRLYGEMVAVLWRHDRVDEALALEDLWNRYLHEKPVPLLCAYPSKQVQGHPAAAAVCGAHDHVFPALVA
jgi:hypothetical protein